MVYNRLGSGLIVNQMVYDFGRTGNLVASARLRADAQDRNFDTTKASVLLETDRSFFDLLRAQALLQVAQRTVEARQLIVDQVTALADAKIKSALDVSFSKVNLADSQLVLVGAQNDVKSARARLSTAMGIPGESNFEVEDTLSPDALPDNLRALVGQALRERPDVASLRLEQSAAQRSAQAERSAMFPSVGLIASAGVVPAAPDVIPGRYGAVGVNVNLPVFNGGLYAARRAEADLRARSIERNVKDLEDRVTRDVQIAYNNAATAYDRIALSAQMLDQARLALELAQRRYDLGLSSIIELSQAQLNQTGAEIAASRAKYDYLSMRRVLDYQLGILR